MEIFKIKNKQGLYWCGLVLEDFKRLNIFHEDGDWLDKNELKEVLTSIKELESDDGKAFYSFLKNNCEIVKFELIEIETIKIE